MTGRVEVSLLGPPRVERDGALLAFDTRKAVALLAHLALADRPRPRDALADLLWPENDPEHARGALRRTLSTLRGGVGVDLIEATRDHVRLIKGPTLVVDVDRFRRLRASGDLEQAVEVFRGEFLEGFGVREAPDFEDWARAEGDGLRRELTSALADLAAARGAAGDPEGAIPAVRRWLSLDPLHEPAHRALIRLYAASGDRSAAMVQYRECVRALSRDLGVSPLGETTRLIDAINRGLYAAAETDAEPSPPPAPGGTSPLVGRADDLRILRACYDGVRDDGRVVLIEGEAGIGKTRLAEELLAPLRRFGAQVLVARAYEDEAGLPYSPIVEILRARLTAGGDWLTELDDRALGEAARLVPELASQRASARLTAIDEPGADTRFMSGVWETLTSAAAGDAPGVLLVDDAQWADEATRGLLSYGLHRLVGRPLLVVLTWRTPNDHQLRNTAAALARASGGAVVHLDRLDEDNVSKLLRAIRPDGGSPEVTRRLWKTTEGVPLLAVEYLRTLGTDDDWPLPTGARELLQARLSPVSETGRQVLAAAAVLGRSFDVDTVRAVSGRTDEETVTALEELASRGLVREGNFGYDFDHELVRSLVYDETSLARRRLLHARAAETLTAPAGSIARHLHLAGRDAEAAEAYREAGEQARLVYANAEALGHLRAALALGHPDRARLETTIGDLQTLLGDYAGALASLELAAAASETTELASVEHRLGRVQHRRGEYALAEARLRAALAATPATDAAARATITADLSLAAHSRGHPDQARALAHEASELATESADPRSRCQAYNLLGLLATADGDTDDALENLLRSREIADDVGDRGLQVAALNNLALAHRARDELEDATKLTIAALDLCIEVGDRHREAALHNNLADLLHASGRSDDAMAHLKSAVEIFAEIGAEEDRRPEIWKLVRW